MNSDHNISGSVPSDVNMAIATHDAPEELPTRRADIGVLSAAGVERASFINVDVMSAHSSFIGAGFRPGAFEFAPGLSAESTGCALSEGAEESGTSIGLLTLEDVYGRTAQSSEPRVFDPAVWYLEPTHFVVPRPVSEAAEVKARYMDVCTNFNIEAEGVSYYPFKAHCSMVCDSTLRSMDFMMQILQTEDRSGLILEFQRRDGCAMLFNYMFHYIRRVFLSGDVQAAPTGESPCSLPTSVVAPMPTIESEPLSEEHATEEWAIIKRYLETVPQEGLRIVGALINQGVKAPHDVVQAVLLHRGDARLRVLVVQVLCAHARHTTADFSGFKRDILEVTLATIGNRSTLAERQCCRMLDEMTKHHRDVLCPDGSRTPFPRLVEALRSVESMSRWPESAKLASAVLERLA